MTTSSKQSAQVNRIALDYIRKLQSETGLKPAKIQVLKPHASRVTESK